MKKLKLLILISSISLLFCAFAVLFLNSGSKEVINHGTDGEMQGMTVLNNTWEGYKQHFIESSGRVVRRDHGDDAVSEGQAYAMLRAIWAGDKETFDRCYRWSEKNLSRKLTNGDNLLAWHWKDGKVADWMPASDADLDYALSLVFASVLWKGKAPGDLEDYRGKALGVLQDILEKETYSIGDRLFLSPWILGNETSQDRKPVNPSYYSPAHFRIFHKLTDDKRWIQLLDTTYFLMDSLAGEFHGIQGVGLIPDWCSVDNQGRFYPLEGKSANFGWDAVRVPIRVGLDYFWFNSEEAKKFFSLGFSSFFEKQWKENGAIFCEYNYNGTCDNPYENPLFYAAYYYALKASNSPIADKTLKRTRDFLVKDGDQWVYDNDRAYYANSLAWMAEGLSAGQVRNMDQGSS